MKSFRFITGRAVLLAGLALLAMGTGPAEAGSGGAVGGAAGAAGSQPATPPANQTVPNNPVQPAPGPPGQRSTMPAGGISNGVGTVNNRIPPITNTASMQGTNFFVPSPTNGFYT